MSVHPQFWEKEIKKNPKNKIEKRMKMNYESFDVGFDLEDDKGEEVGNILTSNDKYYSDKDIVS